jgi:hypothetical protein
MRASADGQPGRKSEKPSAAQRIAAVQPSAARSAPLDLILEAKKRLDPGLKREPPR